MATIPLFPLGSVLFPQGRMSLQIFEPRYLDLVSRCLKDDSGFGVVWLRQGREVHKPEQAVDPRFAQVGCYATIVDWDSLPNGLLGITIEGNKNFVCFPVINRKIICIWLMLNGLNPSRMWPCPNRVMK
ncbi:LON peptidase substrate-binding domain-containing protein [Oceanicoccus sp. KOV_DT_Chl]|uniref:LON peptidase substrate-binding domain-containing protein n=1 Tax=Oceanicoccus sp. KOV_DT_Chl TaxID=1904639 RepID=UPI000C7BE4AA|nr:LON peptidase substrate-binding domain-containing protein [Oceanicoccus sp. KOV_DT_Chl]